MSDHDDDELQESRDWTTIVAIAFALVATMSTARELKSWSLAGLCLVGLVAEAWYAMRIVRSRHKRGATWRGRHKG